MSSEKNQKIYLALSVCLLLCIVRSCEKTNLYQKQYGDCTVNIQTCQVYHQFQLHWKASAQVPSGESVFTFSYDSETGAMEHSVQQLMYTLKACNCETYVDEQDGCQLQIQLCFNYGNDENSAYEVTDDHPQYEAWANLTSNASISGHYCCSYDKSASIERAIQNVIQKETCPPSVPSTTSSQITSVATSGYIGTNISSTSIFELVEYVTTILPILPIYNALTPTFHNAIIVASMAASALVCCICLLLYVKRKKNEQKDKSISLIKKDEEQLISSHSSSTHRAVLCDETTIPNNLLIDVADDMDVEVETDEMLITPSSHQEQQIEMNHEENAYDIIDDEIDNHELHNERHNVANMLDVLNQCKDHKTIQEQRDALFNVIHQYYDTIQSEASNNVPIHKEMVNGILNAYLDILNTLEALPMDQYEAFIQSSRHSQICNGNCIAFTSQFGGNSSQKQSPQCIARYQILDKIHDFLLKSLDITQITQSKHMSNDRSSRWRYQVLSGSRTAVSKKKFDFGRKFIYKDNDEEKASTLLTPKFPNLKTELLDNGKATLTVEQYDAQVEKAALHRQSNWAKRLSSRKNKKCIPEECVLTLLIYSNFDTFQREFSKTYRDKWHKDHYLFFHFGKCPTKWLKEAVLGYGTTIAEGRVKELFHGVSEVLVPSDIVDHLGEGISIYGPLSTSSSFAVANNFAAEGMVMTLGGEHSEATYFAVYHLSDYAYEYEYLFIQNEAKIKLLNIHLTTGDQYRVILEGLETLNATLCRSDYHFDHTNAPDVINYINHQLYGTAFKSEHYVNHKYAQQLMDVYFQRKDKLTINYVVLKKMYKQLFGLFCTKEWIKIKMLMVIFPNIRDITIKGIDLSDSIIDNIYDEYEIFDPNSNDECAWTLNKMKIYLNENSPLNAVEAVERYAQKMKTVKLQFSEQYSDEDDILVISLKT
eukprot:932907_1